MEAQYGRDPRTQSPFFATGRIDRFFCAVCVSSVRRKQTRVVVYSFGDSSRLASRLSAPAFLPPGGRTSARDTDRLGSPYSVSRHLGTGSRTTGLECRLQVARPRSLADGRSVPADPDSRPSLVPGPLRERGDR